jgi:hypothetical protein
MSSRWPFFTSSSPAAVTASADSTSNSSQACGTGTSFGHSFFPKHDAAAPESAQRAKAFTPSRSSVAG